MSVQSETEKGSLGRILRNADLVFTFGLFGTVMLLVLPIPSVLLDLLLAVSIGISLLILLIVIYVHEPPEFSVFLTMLLAVTLFRLGLNVASTRLILLNGYAGNVIDSFGNFVVHGNFVVGAVVFIILVIINFVVITKGARRIAEVAARFTLDVMPGKQMSIDAELNAGVIDERTATYRRMKIQKEADFYGSMDGASKFVRGDAVAGILITIVNVLGGIAIGVLQKGLSIYDAMQKYTLLSIGDGLVTQIPALIVSVAAGILVTRSSESSNLGSFIGRQLTIYPRAIGIAGVMLAIFAILPGMPMAPFMVLASSCWMGAYVMKRKGLGRSVSESETDEFLPASSPKSLPGHEGSDESSVVENPAPDFERIIEIETLSMELGYGLLPLTDREQNGDLLGRITGVRKNIAREMGIIVPPISVRDNHDLESNHYRFLMRGREVVNGMVMPNRWMAMNVANSGITLQGSPTVEPVFGLEAVWITDEEKKTAEIHGYTVVDASSVLITHLSETLREVAHLVLEREDVQKLIDMVKDKNPTLVNELIPDLASVGLIQRVLQNLLKERISIKNLPLILETIADFAGFTKNPDELSEQVRRRIGVYFIQEFESEPGTIKALTLEPKMEQSLVSRVKRSQFDVTLMMDPTLAQHFLNELRPRIEEMLDQGLPPLLVVTTEIRLAFKRFFEPSFRRLTVIAYQEMPSNLEIRNFGMIGLPPGGVPEMENEEVPEAIPA